MTKIHLGLPSWEAFFNGVNSMYCIMKTIGKINKCKFIPIIKNFCHIILMRQAK